jgi:hypothetical protein
MRQVFTVLRWGAVGVGILLGVGSNALNAYQIILLGLPSPIWTAIAFAFFAAGLISLVLHYRQEKQLVIAGSTPQSNVEAVLPRNKLTIVVQEIAKSEQIIPKGNDVIVYLSEFLNVINVEEVYNILTKLQNDEKVLTIKYFPDYLLPFAKFTGEVVNQKQVARQTILDSLEPSRQQFRVETNDKFDIFAKQLGAP